MLDGSPLGVWMRRAQQSRFGEPGARGARPADRSAPGHTLDVQVLGRFAVQLDGEPLELAGLRPLHRELLAVFCAHADVVLHKDRLVEWFWQDTDPARAQHSLQVAVSELRRLLNPSGDRSVPFGIHREGGGYRLRLAGPANCDARRMEQLIQLAAQAEQGGDTARAADVLVSATDLYRGDLLAPMGYPEWVLPERDRLRSVVGDAFERLIQLYAAAGDHAGAVAAARSGLVHNRHRDALWRQLVTSLQALDDRAAAAAAQRSYRELLLELGVPSTD
jgi:DNA-binding SARP family transcriptional activator